MNSIDLYCKIPIFKILLTGRDDMENMKMLKEEMPRERLEKYGVSALSNAELLALILATGTRHKSVLSISNELLQKSGSLKGLFDLELSELKEIDGIGEIKAGKLLAIFEIAKRVHCMSYERKVLLDRPEKVFDYIKFKYIGEKRECIYAISLDSKNQLISADLISIGTVNYSVAHPREIFKYAIKHSAVSLLLIHNHPSGHLEPSREDLNLTRRVESAGEIIGIKLLDHIIVSDESYYSLKENCLM